MPPIYQTLTVADGTGITVTLTNTEFTIRNHSPVTTLTGTNTLTNETITTTTIPNSTDATQ